MWAEDGLFQLENHQEDTFVFWDEAYTAHFKSILIKEKEQRFGFLFGFSYMKKIGNIFVIYSFATKENLNREDCRGPKVIFSEIGDYFFAALANVYQKYIIHPHLRLIVNNVLGGHHEKGAITKDLQDGGSDPH